MSFPWIWLRKKLFKKDCVNLPISIHHCLLIRRQFPHTSSWVLSKELYKKIRFDDELNRYQDLAYIVEVRKKFNECLLINENLVLIKKSINRRKIKSQSLKDSLNFCRKYFNYNFFYSTLFILKYFLYPRIRYFYINRWFIL